jgi:hypothetical protein
LTWHMSFKIGMDKNAYLVDGNERIIITTMFKIEISVPFSW